MKRDQDKTKEQLINELVEIRKQIAELEVSESQQKKAEAEDALRESQEFSASLLSNSPNPMLVINPDTSVKYVNPALEQLTGFTSEEVIGQKTPYRWWTEEMLNKTSMDLKGAMQKGATRLEELFQKKNGERFWVEITSAPIILNGEFKYYLANWIDITERKQAEEELIRLSNAVRMTTDSIVISDLEARIIDVNEATLKMYGTDDKRDLIGIDSLELISPEEREIALKGMRKTLEKGYVKDREFHIMTKDGSKVLVEMSVAVMKGADSKLIGFVGVSRNISERKQAEEKRQKTEKLESVGTLAGGIAHDFNNILTGIMGNIGLAMRHVEPKSKAEERLLEAEKASLRARDLTQQLLTFARGGAPIKQIASITELLEESVTFALRGSNIGCEFSLADNLWSVEVDEGQVNQVITNLVINADEAMPEGGVLNIGAKNRVVKTRTTLPLPEGNYVEITIEDHGVGISREHLSKIFDPYFTTKQKGSGLGLSTAYSIVKNHGGYITAKSKLGVGTTFHIYLPASEKPIPVEKEAVTETAVAGKGKILVMDDEGVIRKLLHDELTDFGYEVELTDYGAEAVERYKESKKSEKPFDAVILDLTVPGGMGGKEVIKKLLEVDPNVKAIVSSGYSTDPIMSDFREYGFSAVVAKPYTMEQLERTLRSILMETGE
jgi:PAS domain S-box-containing protein